MSLEFQYNGWDFRKWDFLLLTGWAAFLLGLIVVHGVPSRLRLTLERLADRRVLLVPDGDLSGVNDMVDKCSLEWGTRTGSVVAAAILIVLIFAAPKYVLIHHPALLIRSSLVPAEMLGGFVAGFHLGRLVSYGRLGRVLRRAGCTLQPRPGHIDKAAGLKPVGDFLLPGPDRRHPRRVPRCVVDCRSS